MGAHALDGSENHFGDSDDVMMAWTVTVCSVTYSRIAGERARLSGHMDARKDSGTRGGAGATLTCRHPFQADDDEDDDTKWRPSLPPRAPESPRRVHGFLCYAPLLTDGRKIRGSRPSPGLAQARWLKIT